MQQTTENSAGGGVKNAYPGLTPRATFLTRLAALIYSDKAISIAQ